MNRSFDSVSYQEATVGDVPEMARSRLTMDHGPLD